MRYNAISDKYRGVTRPERDQAESTLACLDDIELADDYICQIQYEMACLLKQVEYIIATHESGHSMPHSAIVYLGQLADSAKKVMSR